MRLIPIPREEYEAYRLNLMFDCYKWDPQFLDHNTIAKYALVITKEEHEQLSEWTEKLDEETRAAELVLNGDRKLAGPLALPKKLSKELQRMDNYDPGGHVRLMRYDFHPTTEGGWAVSEVNSDVPGGFAEASLMPEEARIRLKESSLWYINFGDILVKAIADKVPEGGRIMLVHCTSYSDDRQVMQFLGDALKEKGFHVIYGAADHIHFREKQAHSILDGNEGKLDAIIRFTPLEWLTEIRPKKWDGYFDTTTVSCNHPVAIYAQTKRFPLVWDALEQKGVCLDTWRKLLPDTLEVKDAKGKEGYIYKPACGRVGENISIKEACWEGEYDKIMKDVKRHPKKYLAQKRFYSRPLAGQDGEQYHVCLGSYTVQGKHAGYYARITESQRIDSNAADIPVLIERSGERDDR
ncbi:MAG: glutathionylspermidine synthase family protein [Lachnospiraceae bacterium]|nr:glutathionylspermidine synthase family protein [Lachnospiraceae bacterium]